MAKKNKRIIKTSEEEIGYHLLNDPNQLAIPIKQDSKEEIYKIKRKVSRFKLIFSILPYWKYVVNVLAFFTSIIVIIVSLLIVLKFYDFIPKQIPLVFNQSKQAWNLIDKEFLISIPIISGILMLIINRLNSSIFKFDRRLALFINGALVLFNILLIIALLELISLVTIY